MRKAVIFRFLFFVCASFGVLLTLNPSSEDGSNWRTVESPARPLAAESGTVGDRDSGRAREWKSGRAGEWGSGRVGEPAPMSEPGASEGVKKSEPRPLALGSGPSDPAMRDPLAYARGSVFFHRLSATGHSRAAGESVRAHVRTAGVSPRRENRSPSTKVRTAGVSPRAENRSPFVRSSSDRSFKSSGENVGARSVSDGSRLRLLGGKAALFAKREIKGSVPSKARPTEIMGGLPLWFEKNQEQGHSRAQYLCRTTNAWMYFEPDRVRMRFETGNSPQQHSAAERQKVITHRSSVIGETRSVEVALHFLASNPNVQLTAEDPFPGKTNYLIGNDPSLWKTDLPQYAKVRYKEIYPGIDLIFYGNQQQLEYDLAVAPGADPGVVALEFTGIEVSGRAGERESGRVGERERGRRGEWESGRVGERESGGAAAQGSTLRTATGRERRAGVGTDTGQQSGRVGERESGRADFRLRIDASGDLVIGTSISEIRQLKPKIYQEINGVKFPVPGRYVLKSVVSGQLSGTNGSQVHRSAGQQVDRSVAGNPHSAIRNPQSSHSAFHTPHSAFVLFQIDSYDSTRPLVIDPQIVFTTTIQANNTTTPFGLVVDSAGNSYICGQTRATDLPKNSGLQSGPAGQPDAFVIKLDPKGNVLFSTYLGGTDFDGGSAIAVDASANIYLAGYTSSANFPTKNPIQQYGGNRDAFIAKLNPSGNALIYSTFLGGSNTDSVSSIAVDGSGNAYLGGRTSSTNFPLKNAFQASPRSIFVAKLDPTGTALIYSSYFGGSNSNDSVSRIALDSAGNLYLAGRVSSSDFPTVNAFQSSLRGTQDAFVAKLNAAGSGLVYSTYLGGDNVDFATGIDVDASGSAYITGITTSTNFPTLNPIQAALRGTQDAIVTKLAPNGSALVYSTYLGGTGIDSGESIAVDRNGRAYIVGFASPDFPLKDPIQTSGPGYLTKISPAGNEMMFSSYLGDSSINGLIAVGLPAAGPSLKADDDPTWRNQGQRDDKAGTLGYGRNNTLNVKQVETGQPTVPPTEEFVETCVKIIDPRQLLETNGLVSRLIGSKLGWKVVKKNTFANIQKVQEAIDFEGTDEAGNTLDFRALDTVKLGPCTFRENVVIPERHKTTGTLAAISIIGEGAVTRIISSSGTTIRIDSPPINVFGTQTKIADLLLNGSGKSDYLIDASGATLGPSLSHIWAEDAVNGFNLPRGGNVDTCTFRNFTGHAIKASGDVTVKAEDFHLSTFENIGDRAISVVDGSLHAANLQFENVKSSAIFITGNGNADLKKIATGKSTAVDVSSVKNKVEMDRITGRRILVQDSPDVLIKGSFIFDSDGPGISIFGSSVKLIDNEISHNKIGIRIGNTSTVQSSLNLIQENAEAGVLKGRSSHFKSDGDLYYFNGRGAKDDVVTQKRGEPFLSAAISATDSFQNDVIMGNTGPGIELTADGNVDLGGGAAGSKGGNIIIGNGQYDLVNSTGVKISAKNNIWSSSDPNEILSKYISPGASADVAPVMPVQAKYFAQFAEAPGFTSTVTLTNPSRTNGAAAVLALRNSTGTGVNVPLNGKDSPGGLQPTTVAPLGARSFSTNPTTNAVNVGSITAASGRLLAGTVLFSGPAGVAGVGASELLTQFIAPVEKSASKSVNSGIAISNPSITAAVTVALRLRENSTGKITEGTLQLAAGGQAAKFIDELFSGLSSEFNGTLSVSAPAQVAATVIRTSPGQFATLPVTGTGSKKLFFAQFGEVTGISSTLTFVNPSLDKTASVTVKIFDDNGAPLTVNLGGQDRPGQITFSVPPQASVSFASPGTSTAAKVGSVIVDSTENIGGTILFGGSFGLAGVGASQALSNFIAPVEQTTQGGVTVGLALMNIGTTQTTVKLTLRDESGTPVDGGTLDVVLKPQGHVAKFLGQFFDKLNLADFRGTITGETTGQVAATVIRQSGVPLEFATLPVAEIIP